MLTGNDIRIIWNIYWGENTCMPIENEIKRTVWQKCVFTLDLFNIYSEASLRELEVLPGIIIDGHKS